MITTGKSTPRIIEKRVLRACIVMLRSDNLMHFQFKSKTIIEVDDVKELVETVKEIGNGKQYANLITADEFVTLGHGVREFSATEFANAQTIADAFVVKTLPEKLLANFYIRINKPPKPTRMFNDENKAIEWLKKQQVEFQARKN